MESGAVQVGLRRWAGDKRWETRNYKKEEVDMLLVYCPQIDKVCMIPSDLFDNKPAVQLRFEPPKHRSENSHMVEEMLW